jgi:hypothetical protein
MARPIRSISWPRFAPGGHFRPSGVISLDCYERDVRTAFDLQRRMESASNRLSAEEQSLLDEIFNVIMHEDFHHLQSIATIYGFFFTEVASAQVRAIELISNNIVQDFGDKAPALFPLIDKVPVAFEFLKRSGRKTEPFLLDAWRLFGASQLAIDAMENRNIEVAKETANQLHDALCLIDESYRWLNAPTSIQKRNAGPRAKPTNATACCGGLDVLEGVAMIEGLRNEGNFIWKAFWDPSEFLARLERVPDEYRRTFQFFLAHVCADDKLTHISMSLFYLCSHLALMPPLHPFYYSLFCGMSIESLHPGLRFERAVRFVADERTRLTRLIEQLKVAEASDKICRALGWPTLQELAGHAHSAPVERQDLAILHRQAIIDAAADIAMFVRLPPKEAAGKSPRQGWRSHYQDVAQRFHRARGPRVIVCRDGYLSTGTLEVTARLVARDIRFEIARAITYGKTVVLPYPTQLANTDFGETVTVLVERVTREHFGLDPRWIDIRCFSDP